MVPGEIIIINAAAILTDKCVRISEKYFQILSPWIMKLENIFNILGTFGVLLSWKSAPVPKIDNAKMRDDIDITVNFNFQHYKLFYFDISYNPFEFQLTFCGHFW